MTEDRKALLKEAENCIYCKRAEFLRQQRDYSVTTTAWCEYHYEKGLKTP